MPMPILAQDAPFLIGESVGILDTKEISEASGLVASHSNPQALWTHNDSGDKNRIFLIGDNAKLLGTFTIAEAEHRDWEDITIGNDNGVSYLYVGDIGDNLAANDLNIIYRFPEPNVQNLSAIPIHQTITNVEKIRFRYPDGKRDAECMMFDPISKDIIIISKREDNVGIYVATYPQSLTEIITLQKMGELPFSKVVAGNISTNGREVLIKSYDKIYYWKREGSENISELLKKPFANLPYKQEPQGESIAWKSDSSGFYTLSENPLNIPLDLFFYRRR